MSKSIGYSHPIETYTNIKQNVKIYRVYSSHKNIYKISQMSKSIGSSHPIKTYTKIKQNVKIYRVFSSHRNIYKNKAKCQNL
jgi:hypothetical protein